jgi:ketosteroid isomerase-like protein
LPRLATREEAFMSAEENLSTVRIIYEAFGTGDVATILDHLTDDVDWGSDSAEALAPWHGEKHGKDEVATFFEGIAGASEVLEFTPLSFTSNETDVQTLIRYRMRSTATGREAVMNLHHFWRFRDGRVEKYRGSEDTALTAATLSD